MPTRVRPELSSILRAVVGTVLCPVGRAKLRTDLCTVERVASLPAERNRGSCCIVLSARGRGAERGEARRRSLGGAS